MAQDQEKSGFKDSELDHHCPPSTRRGSSSTAVKFGGLTGDNNTGEYQDCGASPMLVMGEPPPWCTPESSLASNRRSSAVQRYKDKKKTRKFEKRVRYTTRKARAGDEKQILRKRKRKKRLSVTSVILPEIPTLDQSSHDDMQLILNKDPESRTPITLLLTSLRMVPVFLAEPSILEIPALILPAQSTPVLNDNTTEWEKWVEQEKVDATVDLIQDAFKVVGSGYDGLEMSYKKKKKKKWRGLMKGYYLEQELLRRVLQLWEQSTSKQDHLSQVIKAQRNLLSEIYAPKPLFSEYELEEGEIDESDVPKGCEPIFEEVVTKERKIISEDEEYEDGDAFSDDCLFYGLSEKFNQSYKEIQGEIERSRARAQRAIQRREARESRESYLRGNRRGSEWDEIKRKMDKSKIYHKLDPGNRNILNTVEKYIEDYSNIHDFYDQFNRIITSTTVNILKNGWKITGNHIDGLQMKISTSVLKKLNIGELFVPALKIPWLKSNKNEYFRDKLQKVMMDVSPQAFIFLFVIKSIRSKRAKLEAPGIKRSEANFKAAEVLYAYRLNDMMIRNSEGHKEDPIKTHLETGWLPDDAQEARKLSVRALRYSLIEGLLYKRVDELSPMLWAYRTTSKVTTDATPFMLAYGAEVVVLLEITHGSPRVEAYEPGTNE
ncbi:hypothetical protein AgCh_038039 [Apium graveolens]